MCVYVCVCVCVYMCVCVCVILVFCSFLFLVTRACVNNALPAVKITHTFMKHPVKQLFYVFSYFTAANTEQVQNTPYVILSLTYDKK